MDKKNVIMVDMPVSKDWGILKGLQEETKEPWYTCYKEDCLFLDGIEYGIISLSLCL